jgi:hypothetical protein
MTSFIAITTRLVSLITHQLVFLPPSSMVRCSATENPKYEPGSPNFITGILGSRLKLAALCKMHNNITPPHKTRRAILINVRKSSE